MLISKNLTMYVKENDYTSSFTDVIAKKIAANEFHTILCTVSDFCTCIYPNTLLKGSGYIV